MQGGQRQQQREAVGPQAGPGSAASDAARSAGPGLGSPGAPPQTGAYALPLQQQQPALAAPLPHGLVPGLQPQWPLQWQLPADAAGAAPVAPPHVDPDVMAAKLAAAREKNRLAQQRFRERRRLRQQQAGEQCEVVQQEIDQLEAEIEALRTQNRIYQRVLAVRDAMLVTFTSLQPPEAQAAALQQPDAAPTPAQQAQAAPLPQLPAPEAAGGLVAALRELPSEGELDAAAQPSAAVEQQAAGEGAQVAHAGTEAATGAGGSGGSSNDVGHEAPLLPSPVGSAPQSLLGEAHRTGTASSLDGSVLREVEEVPPPSNKALLARIQSWAGPEDLLAFVRKWQAELRMVYQAADAAGFDAHSVEEVENLLQRMTEMWWHVGQLRPAYLSYLAHVALPENSGQLPLWREIAAEVMPYINDSGLALLRRSWHNYSKRLAQVAVKMSKWVHKLQTYTVQPMEGLVTNAQRGLELAEISSHIAAAVQEEYVASMELVARQYPVSSKLLQAYTNYRCAPYLPDVTAIVYNIVCLDSEQRAAQAVEGYRPRLLASRPAPSSHIPHDPHQQHAASAQQP